MEKKKRLPADAATTKVIIVLMMIVLLVGNALFAQAPRGGEQAYTPPAGSAERKAVLDTLRAWVMKQHHLEVVFKVKHLKIKDRYAWVEVAPRSKDGSNQYEDISALLKKENEQWAVVEVPCTEEENPNCLGDPGYFKGLKKRFPGLSPDIFPRK